MFWIEESAPKSVTKSWLFAVDKIHQWKVSEEKKKREERMKFI